MDDHHHDCLYTVCACVCICMVFVFPRSAAVMTPLKWRAVKSGHRRSEYLYYLGDPNSDTSKWHSNGDKWISYNGNYTFEMQVDYKDSIGRAVYLKYHFKTGCLIKTISFCPIPQTMTVKCSTTDLRYTIIKSRVFEPGLCLYVLG